MKCSYLKNWRILSLGLAMLSLATSSAFAAANNCKNPTEIKLKGNVKIKFCEIPAGTAAIGDQYTVGDHDNDPVKRNFQSFQMGQFTVTQAQYKAIVGEEPWKKDGQLLSNVKEGDNYPAVYVSYFQARRFAEAMNLIDPHADYRLPTEAEFEYAARAGTATDYYWGDNWGRKIDPSYAYYRGNSEGVAEYARDVTTCPDSARDKQHPGYCANGFGLMHMLGNVSQWTTDVHLFYTHTPINGNLPVVGPKRENRIHRGGAWSDGIAFLRSWERDDCRPDTRVADLGFRLVRTVRPDERNRVRKGRDKSYLGGKIVSAHSSSYADIYCQLDEDNATSCFLETNDSKFQLLPASEKGSVTINTDRPNTRYSYYPYAGTIGAVSHTPEMLNEASKSLIGTLEIPLIPAAIVGTAALETVGMPFYYLVSSIARTKPDQEIMKCMNTSIAFMVNNKNFGHSTSVDEDCFKAILESAKNTDDSCHYHGENCDIL